MPGGWRLAAGAHPGEPAGQRPSARRGSGHGDGVRDDRDGTGPGPGFPERLLREGPQRFLTGAPERGQGTGLGLTIALGRAQVIGARVTLANPRPAGAAGASATVELPPA